MSLKSKYFLLLFTCYFLKFELFMQSFKIGSDDIIFQPVKLQFLEGIQQSIQKIFAISNRSYVICENFVATWGSKVFKKDERETDFVQMIPINVNELGVGANHTFAYTVTKNVTQNNSSNRKVFCWGSNKSYELGLQQEREYSLQEVLIFDQALQAGFQLLQISCGDNHTLALLGDQQTGQTKLFGWGESKSYQLALDTTSIVPYPVDIQYNFTSYIDKIYSKSDYNIAITNSGELYSWGSNLFNRLGVNGNKSSKNSPTQTTRVAVSYEHNFNKKHHQQKISQKRTSFIENTSTNIQKVKIPRKIQIENCKIASIALGTYHVVALTTEGSCFTWGNGISGQLGNNKYGQCSPEMISIQHLPKGIKFIDCSAGQHHSCLLDNEGNVYTCGSNSFGVLGHQKNQNQTKKKRCKIFQKIDFFSQNCIQISHISSGDRHCLALSSKQQVFGWGSNKSNQIIVQNYQNQHDLSSTSSIDSIQSQAYQYSINQQHYSSNNENFLKNQRNSNIMNQHKQIVNHHHQQKYLQLLDKKKFTQNGNIQWQKIKQWKNRYNQFLLKKRKEEDQFMEELATIIMNLNKKL